MSLNLLIFVWLLITVLADSLAKTKISPIIIASVYLIQSLLWSLSLFNGLTMAKGSVLFGALGLTIGVIVGAVAGEQLTVVNWIGFVLAIISIVLTSL